MPRLLTLDEAATELGVPKASLRAAAEHHGLLVKFGKTVRFDPATIPEIIKLCRENPKVPASTCTRSASSFTSATAHDSLERAQETAEKLKRPSLASSPKKAGQLVRLRPTE